MGPLISEEQRERVLGFLERAAKSKATIVTGGESLGDRGFFVKPTVVTDVEAGLGDRPGRGLRPGRDRAAVRRRTTRRSRWRTACATGSRPRSSRENVGRALKVAARLDFGTVWVNEHLFPLASEMPHGGFKESGYGKDMSIYSMEEYTRIKHVAVKLAE